MRRHWSLRLLGTLSAVWFILVGIEPATFGACPAHTTASPSAAHSGHSMHMAAGTAVSHHARSAGKTSQSSDEHGPHQCTCPGSCCGPTLISAPSAQPPYTTTSTFAAKQQAVERVYRAAWTDFVLPFATAPPQGSLA